MTGNTFVGVDYFLQELRRRDADRAEAAVYELGQRAYWLSIISGLRGVRRQPGGSGVFLENESRLVDSESGTRQNGNGTRRTPGLRSMRQPFKLRRPR
jgi:hypothetical protein